MWVSLLHTDFYGIGAKHGHQWYFWEFCLKVFSDSQILKFEAIEFIYGNVQNETEFHRSSFNVCTILTS